MSKGQIIYYKKYILPELSRQLSESEGVSIPTSELDNSLTRSIMNVESIKDLTDEQMTVFLKTIRIKSAREFGIFLKTFSGEPEYDGLFIGGDIIEHEKAIKQSLENYKVLSNKKKE